MTTIKAGPGFDRKMASPRALLALSALHAVRSVVTRVARLLGARQTPSQKSVSGTNDQFCETLALNRERDRKFPA